MIKAVTVTNLETGDDLLLTLASPETSQGFAVLDMSGLGPEQATLNSSEWVTIDGGTIDATHMPIRHITMRLRFIPTIWQESVADIRRKSYIYFPLKKRVKLTFHQESYQHKFRNLYIEGCITKNSPPIWSKEEGCDLEIVCDDPRFKSVEEKTESYSQIRGVFHFPFIDHEMIVPTEDDGRLHGFEFPIGEIMNYREKDITCNSSIDTGAIFTMKAVNGSVVNPYLYNRTTNERMDMEYTIAPGEIVIFDTREGHKSIYSGDGTETKLIQYLAINSEFIKFIPGVNQVGFGAEEGAKNVDLTINYRELYQGI